MYLGISVTKYGTLPIHLNDDPEVYTTEVDGNIQLNSFIDDNDKTIGDFRLSICHFSLAYENNVSWLEVLDAHSEDSSRFAPLFTEDAELQPEVIDILGDTSFAFNHFLIIDRINIVKEHRGRNYGLYAIQALINQFGGCHEALVGIQPCPFQDDPNDASWDYEIAVNKLRNYYEWLGFRSIPDTEVMLLTRAYKSLPLPTIKYPDEE